MQCPKEKNIPGVPGYRQFCNFCDGFIIESLLVLVWHWSIELTVPTESGNTNREKLETCERLESHWRLYCCTCYVKEFD